MKLDKLILVNWANLQPGDYEFGNMTLLTGATGAGKSTKQDALQTVMTATYQGIFSFNPAQGETTQNSRNGKTKRTLWSYIVGAADNLYARPDGAHGYVAAVFQPSEGEEGKPFTAIVAAAARVDGAGERRQAIQEKLALLIVDGAVLTYEDFCSTDKDGSLSVHPVDKIDVHLKAKYAQVHNLKESKREYLCQLYGRFRGAKSVPFPEAESAAKAWVQAIAQKEIGSVNELIRDHILDHDKVQLGQRIGQVSEMMRQISGLRKDGERLEESIKHLEHLYHHASTGLNHYCDQLVLEATDARRIVDEDGKRETEYNDRIRDAGEELERLKTHIEELKQDSSTLEESRSVVQAKLMGIPAEVERKNIEARIEEAKKQVGQAIHALLANIGDAKQLYETSRKLLGYEFAANQSRLTDALTTLSPKAAACSNISFEASQQTLKSLATSTELNTRDILELSKSLDGLDKHFQNLYQALAGANDSFIAALQRESGSLAAAIASAQERQKAAHERKSNLAGGGADYPRHTLVALKRMREDLPMARVQVLCDLIEPVDVAWQSAIEGFMGGARFNFVVETEWEGRAIEFVRKNNLRANIIQGAMCMKHANPRNVHPNSIIHELITEHPIAKAYLIDQFGSVEKVTDVESLRFTSRGLMIDGKASASRTMFVAEAMDLVFGKEARRQAYLRAEKEHEEAESLLIDLQEQQRELKSLSDLVGKCRQVSFADVGQLDRAARAMEAATHEMARLDLTEADELHKELIAIKAQINSLVGKQEESNRRIGTLQNQQKQMNIELQALLHRRKENEDKLKSAVNALRNLSTANPEISFTNLMEMVEGNLANHRTATRITDALNDARTGFTQSVADTRSALESYNLQTKHQNERFDFNLYMAGKGPYWELYRTLVELQQAVKEQLRLQRDIGLVKNIEEIRKAEDSFKDVFTKQFCYEIRNAVDNGINTLRALNKELERLKFGTDKFKIDWSHWEPEYQQYYDFFVAAYDLSESREGGNLFGKEELELQHCAVRDKLVALLLDDDQDHASQELMRIADYRNYRRYEIWRESDTGSRVALSGWGTGSGGELETPAYIIRAAVLTCRLKLFEKGAHLKIMMHDEAFSLMDERRAHDVISYIRDTLGMQIILAMPTKQAGGLRPEFNKEWSYTKTEAVGNGEVSFVTEADERDLRPDKLRDLWEQRRQAVREQARIAFDNDDEERKAA
ncbi:ATP-binding protein [Noviherbaspirillum saxi]|uniref:AAA family ATPase n=1 Tax=Noviherbaspirillum saxi TaxID=2320863 RepID=A0A3A3FZH0_9BURK|nr:SbcC/MukB-like Walker B domain-containing protein [Noviherbaspirillum saxi]RJF92479.1 AAA family ATPase [Noviherbaspirillum saxi]